MNNFNIFFPLENETHIASIYYKSYSRSFEIYFTDVELIVKFGSKAVLTQDGEFLIVKEIAPQLCHQLREAITQQIDSHRLEV